LRSDTSGGTDTIVGAKLRMELTPAAIMRSATSWAALAGVAMMPMSMWWSPAMASSSSMWRTRMPLISVPTTRGSASTSAATGKPLSLNPA